MRTVSVHRSVASVNICTVGKIPVIILVSGIGNLRHDHKKKKTGMILGNKINTARIFIGGVNSTIECNTAALFVILGGGMLCL